MTSEKVFFFEKKNQETLFVKTSGGEPRVAHGTLSSTLALTVSNSSETSGASSIRLEPA
jgi:hypothetical protein